MSVSFLKKFLARAVCSTVLLTAPAQSYACGFDGLLGNSFSALHPRSVQVAFAIRDAVEGGLTPASVLNPITPGSAGYWRAMGRLRQLHRLLSATSNGQAAAPPPIAILFIDSNLWTRFHSVDGRIEATVHAVGARGGDAEVITSEAILAELLARRISAGQALKRGLVEVHGSRAADVERWLEASLNPGLEESAASHADLPGFSLFGKPSAK